VVLSFGAWLLMVIALALSQFLIIIPQDLVKRIGVYAAYLKEKVNELANEQVDNGNWTATMEDLANLPPSGDGDLKAPIVDQEIAVGRIEYHRKTTVN
jgi:hypothetical protein